MVISLKNRNFLKLLDYTPAEIQHLIDLAIELKAAKSRMRKANTDWQNIALIFEKPLPAPDARLKSPLSTVARR